MYSPRANHSRLIFRNDDPDHPTTRKDGAAREALAQGLGEYLAQLSFPGTAGRDIAFKTINITYGDLWTPDDLPAVNIHGGIGDAEYDSRGCTGSPIQADVADPRSDLTSDRDPVTGAKAGPLQKVALFSPSTFEVDFTVEVWASDDQQRRMIDRMLEDDFNPTPDWLLGGFRLELPHYGGARADYHLSRSSIAADGREAKQGKYKGRYVISASLDLRVPRQRAKMIPMVNKVVTNGVVG